MAAIELIPLNEANLGLTDTTYRPDDEDECVLYGSAAVAARKSYECSETSYAIYLGGELVGFCGYTAKDGLFAPADLWLLTTGAVERHRLTFVKFARAAVAYLHQRHQLRIVVAIRYSRALRLASDLGFRFGEPDSDGFVQGVTD